MDACSSPASAGPLNPQALSSRRARPFRTRNGMATRCGLLETDLWKTIPSSWTAVRTTVVWAPCRALTRVAPSHRIRQVVSPPTF
jgi:hypothetical protein